MSRNNATLHDVGALAGVAARTVSRVVNKEPGVSAKTVEKVNAAIAALKFRPNIAARALKSDRSVLVALIVPTLGSNFVSTIIRGVGRACREHGYYLTLEEHSPDESGLVASTAGLLRSVRLAGAILTPPHTDDDALLALLEAEGVRTVRISPLTAPDRTPAIVARDSDGVNAIVDHLVRLGHRRFGLLQGPADHKSSYVRHSAFIAALTRHGIEADDILIERATLFHEAGLAATTRLLMQGRPTAICAFNDEMAAGAVAAISNAGLSVPKDIAVTGFDDSDLARMLHPALTTAHQPIMEMAARAAQMIFDDAIKETCVEFPVELVIRQSSGGPLAR